MRPGISIISAGAGSGKTHRVVQELLRRLAPDDGTEPIAPGSILVTTFTRLAAAEVAERVREALLMRDRDDLARRLGEGLIGTVDSVASELVRRFAFDAGLSPQTVVIDQEEGYRAFSDALAISLDPETLELMHQAEEALGLERDDDSRGSFNPFQGRGWRKTAMEIAQMARSNALDGPALLECAEKSVASLERLFPPAAADGDGLDLALARAIREALVRIPAEKDTTKTTAEYKKELEELGDRLSTRSLPWADWVRWSGRTPGTKSRDATDPVRSAASRHLVHPRLRRDMSRYIRTVFGLAARSIESFQRWKEARGLLDFVDLETRALWLLSKPDVAGRLAERIRLVLVDEFQDTDPLQLALFLKLAGIGAESVWVGDPKQTIYEFRGADPKLMGAVLRQLGSPRSTDILSHSYRSRRELVELVSELFVPAFDGVLPPEQVRLEAKREELPELPAPIQHWAIADVKSIPEVSAAIARGITGLLRQPVLVVDKETKRARSARPSDIAVLCFSRSRCQHISNALESVGIRTALERGGLLDTPEAVLILACLRRLVDPGDSLATAEIVSLTSLDPEPESWLAERISYLQTGQPSSEWRKLDPAVAPLEDLREQLDSLAPSEVLDRVLDVMDAHRKVLAWGREEVRLGNLEALRRLSANYEEGCSRVHSGASVAGLVHWLEDLAAAGRDQQSKGVGPDAVQILTVHGSKGLEWPIVVLAHLDREFVPNVWTLGTVEAQGELNLTDPLAGRSLHFWPWPYGAIRKVPGLEALLDRSPEQRQSADEQRAEAVRLLYVAMTRARDAIVLPSWPARGSKQGSPDAWLDLVSTAGSGVRRFVLPGVPGEQRVPLTGTGITVRVATSVLSPEETVAAANPTVLWFRPSHPETPGPPARINAGDLKLPAGERIEASAPIALGAPMPVGPGADVALVGNAVHGFFAADDPALPRAERAAMASELLRRHEALRVAPLTGEMLIERAGQLRTKLAGLHGEGKWFREWPARLVHEETLVPGWIDLAVDTPAGWILVDHKCYTGPTEEWSAFASACAPQLAAYALALVRATGRPIVAAYVHLAVGGALVQVAIPSGAELDAFMTRVIEGAYRGSARSLSRGSLEKNTG